MRSARDLISHIHFVIACRFGSRLAGKLIRLWSGDLRDPAAARHTCFARDAPRSVRESKPRTADLSFIAGDRASWGAIARRYANDSRFTGRTSLEDKKKRNGLTN